MDKILQNKIRNIVDNTEQYLQYNELEEYIKKYNLSPQKVQIVLNTIIEFEKLEAIVELKNWDSEYIYADINQTPGPMTDKDSDCEYFGYLYVSITVSLSGESKVMYDWHSGNNIGNWYENWIKEIFKSKTFKDWSSTMLEFKQIRTLLKEKGEQDIKNEDFLKRVKDDYEKKKEDLRLKKREVKWQEEEVTFLEEFFTSLG